MSKCPHCGDEHEAGARFCTVTGQPIEAQQPKKKKISPWLFVGLAGAALMCLVGVLVAAFVADSLRKEDDYSVSRRDDEEEEERPTRTARPVEEETSEPTKDVSLIYTQVAATVAAELTEMASEYTPAPTSTQTPLPTMTTAAQNGDFYIGFVTDNDGINDNAFNQAAWEGLLMAAELYGIQVDYLESQTVTDYEENIRLFAEIGADMIVTTSFLMGEATTTVAVDYPDIVFLGIDQYQTMIHENVTGLMFDEWQAGFQAGVLAATLTETQIIAGVYGTNLVPPVVEFAEGFADGAHYINADIKVITTYHPGEMSEAFVDAEWGFATAWNSISEGADVIFGVGGATGNGALIGTAEYENCWCIGVDVDQWNTVPEAHGCLVSSAIKEIQESVVTAVRSALFDSLPAGNYFGTTGLAPFHDFDDEIPENTRLMLAEIRTALMNGDIRYEDFH